MIVCINRMYACSRAKDIFVKQKGAEVCRQDGDITLVTKTAPYSVYVSTPTSANVVCDEKIRSPHPCVVCM